MRISGQTDHFSVLRDTYSEPYLSPRRELVFDHVGTTDRGSVFWD